MLTSLDWNLVVTARSGRRRDLVHALRPILRLRRAGFPEVLVGRTDDLVSSLAALASETHPTVRQEILARVIPIERTFTLDPGALEAQLIAETTAVVADLVGRSFHVRVERRGLREVARSDVLERTLGGALVRALTDRGDHPRVTFDDPDVVVAVELIGTVGGNGLLDRAVRVQYPFVRA